MENQMASPESQETEAERVRREADEAREEEKEEVRLARSDRLRMLDAFFDEMPGCEREAAIAWLAAYYLGKHLG